MGLRNNVNEIKGAKYALDKCSPMAIPKYAGI